MTFFTKLRACCAAVALMATIASAQAAAPLSLSSIGFFYVGGKMTEIDGKAMMIDHM
jgi:hypothetical protein